MTTWSVFQENKLDRQFIYLKTMSRLFRHAYVLICKSGELLSRISMHNTIEPVY